MTVPRQHAFVIRSAEPQQPQRGLYQFVLRNHGLSRIRILVRPVVGLRQGALADQARHAVLPFDPRLFQCLRSRHDPRDGLVLLARTGEDRHPSVGPERAEQIPDKFPVTWLKPGSRQILADDQGGEVGREAGRRHIADMGRESDTIGPCTVETTPDRIDLLRRTVEDDQVKL